MKSEDLVFGHLRVLDLADQKGVLCSRLLADMGADVIKVEKPGGDSTRETRTFEKDVPYPHRSLYFWYYNINKRSITLDLEAVKGRSLFRKLASTADVLIETFTPGYLEKLGLSYRNLSQVNPRLVLTSITHFGQTGPERDNKSCDLVASALGGQMYVCGEPHGPPLKPFGEQAYCLASLFGAIGTLLALHHRRFSGEGQHIDVSIQESVAATVEHVLVNYFCGKEVSRRQGSLHWNNGFHLFRCRDGYISLSLFQQWDTLVEWLDSEGRAEDLKDEKWRSPQARLQGIEHIIEVLGRWTQAHSALELMEQGQRMHFPWAVVNSPEDILQNHHLKERGFFVEVSGPDGCSMVKVAGAPYKFSRSPWRISRQSPFPGQHNKEIYLGELGLSERELHALEVKGII